jgi:chromosome partitioning protein
MFRGSEKTILLASLVKNKSKHTKLLPQPPYKHFIDKAARYCYNIYEINEGELHIMAKIICFSNQKGGVGKTTTCVNLSAYLAVMGKKVLLIDIDPQGNATTGLAVEKSALTKSVYSLLTGDYQDIRQTIKPTAVANLDIIPSNIDLAGAEIELAAMPSRDKRLLTALKNVEGYDYVMIDCPPSLGLLTINALAASTSVLIPIQSEFYALEGLSQLMNTIRLVIKHLNPALILEGVVLTMYDSRSLISRQIAEEIKKYYSKKLYTVKIPRNIRLSEAPSHGVPIHLHDPRCSGALAYRTLAEEFLSRQND